MKRSIITLAICIVAAMAFRGNAQAVAETTIGATLSPYGNGGAFIPAGGFVFNNNIRLQGEVIITTNLATPAPFLVSAGFDIHPIAYSDFTITPLIGAGYALWSTDAPNNEVPNKNTWTAMAGLRFQPFKHLFAQAQITKKAVSGGIGWCWQFDN